MALVIQGIPYVGGAWTVLKEGVGGMVVRLDVGGYGIVMTIGTRGEVASLSMSRSIE